MSTRQNALGYRMRAKLLLHTLKRLLRTSIAKNLAICSVLLDDAIADFTAAQNSANAADSLFSSTPKYRGIG
ncbi:hypothetical protein [Tolypothrix sp. VBCCA 56010]|uniref:hypothetical protein n=1 Tax=Tolypothrix sp. VBCCA 56010 TaxID=3137731 RepID=UPI003D7C9503